MGRSLYTHEYKKQSVEDKKSNLLYRDQDGRSIGVCSCCRKHVPLFQGEAREGERWLETHHIAPRLFPDWLMVVCNRCHLGRGRSHRGWCLHDPKFWSEKYERNVILTWLPLLVLSACARRYAKKQRRKHFPDDHLPPPSLKRSANSAHPVKRRIRKLKLKALRSSRLIKRLAIVQSARFILKPRSLVRHLIESALNRLSQHHLNRPTQPAKHHSEPHSSTHPNFFT